VFAGETLMLAERLQVGPDATAERNRVETDGRSPVPFSA